MSQRLPQAVEGVLFDLDGTLLDSAPDLYAALRAQCAEEDIQPPPYARVRQVVSRGARAVLRCGFAARGEAVVESLVPRYLQLYQRVMGQQTSPFDGVDDLLVRLEAGGLRWGIVTNKAAFLTDELVGRIGWAERASAVISGDTLPVKKPDPAPVLLACERAGVSPAHCLFVGDDQRDIQAGTAAGLFTVAVTWGYLDGGDPHGWGADAVLEHPGELAALLQLEPASA
ncbi:MAG: phosphoglycolate phosphatase [Rhodanobacter sp.]|nr:MAG: phosphoglycolate phosphatase [Rhodanobacter sp.]TAL96823.1 MAG: phosphoglycolate phosphatase [Rhodanobacter sp.]TAM39953.1 MAG: phosphoglycolate phosphatase [Rhodanobacter sp.]